MGVNRFGKLLSFALAAALCYGQLVASAHFVEHLPSVQAQSPKQTQSQSHTQSPAQSPLLKGSAIAPVIVHAVHKPQHGPSHRHDNLASHTSDAYTQYKSVERTSASAHTDVEHTSHSKEHGGRLNSDCSIYHIYSGLNGLVQARTDLLFNVSDHVVTSTSRVAHAPHEFSLHQPIRAPPHFS